VAVLRAAIIIIIHIRAVLSSITCDPRDEVIVSVSAPSFFFASATHNTTDADSYKKSTFTKITIKTSE